MIINLPSENLKKIFGQLIKASNMSGPLVQLLWEMPHSYSPLKESATEGTVD